MTQEQIAKRKETEKLILKEIKAQFGEIDNATLCNNVYAISQLAYEDNNMELFSAAIDLLSDLSQPR